MLTDEYGFRYQCGYAKPATLMTLEDKDCIVRAVWLHYVLYHPHAELEQLRRGLYSTLQFKHLIQSHPKELWGLLATSTVFNVTSKFLCNEFAIQYSPNGSNSRTKEEALVLLFFEYITDCGKQQDVTVGDILKFISGSEKIPATGFDSIPKIGFTDDDRLPTASTCDLFITFSRRMATLDYDEFKNKMDFCIHGSHGFGIV